MPATNLFYAPGAGLHEDEDQLRVGVGQPAVELQRKLLLRCIGLHPAVNSCLLFLLLPMVIPQVICLLKGARSCSKLPPLYFARICLSVIQT